MANTKSAIKRIRRISKQTSVNKARKSRYKNALKKMNALIDANKKSEALKFLPKLNSELMKIAKTGIIKKQNASRNVSRISKKITSFSFFGPTCDSLDYMKGPFLLPNNIKEGDYIELGQLGAYGLTFRTNFNGFYSNEIFEVNDKPIMSLHEESNEKVDSLVA